MTPEQIEHHLKRFEEIMRFKGFVNAHFEKNRIGGYRDMEIQSRFSGYLTAIESIEIELPKREAVVNDRLDAGYNLAIDECKAYISEQGIKVKP